MNETLSVTMEALKTTSSNFSSKATQVKSLHDTMISTVNTLCNTYQGEASTEYKTKFSALQESMDALYAMIMEHSTDLYEMAENYLNAEKTAQELAEETPVSSLA